MQPNFSASDHTDHDKGVPIIPDDHPRAQSLRYRHKLVDGMFEKIVTPSGLTAHGRGEAFDYMLGEKSPKTAIIASEAAVIALLIAKHPVISVNGNTAALIPKEMVKLSEITGAPLEVNLFYQAPGRLEAIEKILKKAGAKKILGLGDVPAKQISELSSNRRIVDPRGIYKADVVMVPLEDGDRTEALVREGKFVIAIDLNPLSRTALHAQITIVDNIIRCFPKMIEIAKEFKKKLEEKNISIDDLKEKLDNFDQMKNLKDSIQIMIDYLKKRKETLFQDYK